MMQIIEQTDEEKLAMYMKEPKKKLAEMLLQCNKILDSTIRANENFVLSDVIKSVCDCTSPISGTSIYKCGRCGKDIKVR